jgi:ribose transport system permease protein
LDQSDKEKSIKRINPVGDAFKKNIFNVIHHYPVALVLILIIIAVSLIAENYFTIENFLNVLRQISVIGILSCGMTFVIIAGGIDLSVGAIISFSGALIINMVIRFSTVPGIIITVAAGAFIGMLSGMIITGIKGKLGESFMITFGMQTVVAAVTLIYTGGLYQSGAKDPLFVNLGRGFYPIIIFVFITACMQFLLIRTRFGRNVYFIGGNIHAARLSGISIKLHRVVIFALSGALAAIAAIVLTSRVGTASPTSGVGYELDAIAAVVVGGVSMTGGHGNILNTLLGVVIMGVLGNALNMLNVSSYPQMIIKGIVIILAVTLDAINKRKL